MQKHKLCYITLAFCCSLAYSAHAQYSDDRFNPNANGTVFALAVQPDGKIIIGGDYTEVDGEARNYIARVHQNGHFAYSQPKRGTNGFQLFLSISKMITGHIIACKSIKNQLHTFLLLHQDHPLKVYQFL